MGLSSLTRIVGLATGGAVLSAALVGATAFATAPSDTSAAAANVPADTAANASAERAGKDHRGTDRLAEILQRLVDRGVITAAQKQAILDELKTVKTDTRDRGGARHFLGDVFKTSATYLGLSADDLRAKLKAGKSLGEIANATPGKSRDGLVAALTGAAKDAIQNAVKSGKLTADQAKNLEAKLPAAIVKVVDHKGHTRAK